MKCFCSAHNYQQEFPQGSYELNAVPVLFVDLDFGAERGFPFILHPLALLTDSLNDVRTHLENTDK